MSVQDESWKQVRTALPLECFTYLHGCSSCTPFTGTQTGEAAWQLRRASIYKNVGDKASEFCGTHVELSMEGPWLAKREVPLLTKELLTQVDSFDS